MEQMCYSEGTTGWKDYNTYNIFGRWDLPIVFIGNQAIVNCWKTAHC